MKTIIFIGLGALLLAGAALAQTLHGVTDSLSGGGSPTPPAANFRITSTGDFRITSTGDSRIISP